MLFVIRQGTVAPSACHRQQPSRYSPKIVCFLTPVLSNPAGKLSFLVNTGLGKKGKRLIVSSKVSKRGTAFRTLKRLVFTSRDQAGN